MMKAALFPKLGTPSEYLPVLTGRLTVHKIIITGSIIKLHQLLMAQQKPCPIVWDKENFLLACRFYQ